MSSVKYFYFNGSKLQFGQNLEEKLDGLVFFAPTILTRYLFLQMAI